MMIDICVSIHMIVLLLIISIIVGDNFGLAIDLKQDLIGSSDLSSTEVNQFYDD